ncbi:hypothetical protein [Methylobacterium brachiatum]
MSIGFGSLPSFEGSGDQTPLSPALQDWLLQQQAQQLAQAQGQEGIGQGVPQDVPQAIPPGFTGYQPQTAPTGAPTDVVRPEAASLASAAMNALGTSSAQAATPGPGSMSDAQALVASARRIGADPLDLATVISYESGGTFSPSKWGGAGGRHVGLIQFGPQERNDYGASPNQSFQEQLPAVERYLTARGFQPGMDRLDLYSTINAGRPGRYNASDAGNGGAPGSVADKVANQMGPHEAKAAAFLGGEFQSPMQQSSRGQGLMPGIASPNGGSMGSTAQRGGFGLGGFVGQGAVVPGRASPTASVAALSGQPLTTMTTSGFSSDPAAQPDQSSNQYAQISNALKSIAGGQQKQGQQKAGGGMPGTPDVGGRPISLQQARAMFDPGKFYGMLRNAGVGSQGRGS